MWKQLLAVVLSAAMVSTGCASASGARTPIGTPAVVDQELMADYVQRIPAGSRVKVERTNGESMRATMMKATAQSIVVQRNTRVPESPVEIPIAEIARVTLDQGGSSTAKAIGIGIASGVGAFFAIIAVAFAAWSD